MREYLQRWFIRFIVKDIFHLVTADEILKVNKDGEWEYRGRKLSKDVVEELKSQAKSFRGSTLWRILKAELQWQAAKTLMEKGETPFDIRAAQLMGYLTKVVDDKLRNMESE